MMALPRCSRRQQSQRLPDLVDLTSFIKAPRFLRLGAATHHTSLSPLTFARSRRCHAEHDDASTHLHEATADLSACVGCECRSVRSKTWARSVTTLIADAKLPINIRNCKSTRNSMCARDAWYMSRQGICGGNEIRQPTANQKEKK